MANEEQRRAFESYMGRSGSSNAQAQTQAQTQAQPVAQYPGSVAQPGNPYLYQVSSSLHQFPGLGAPPAAPTPPPAAPSSVASHPSYQGGYPHAAYIPGVYDRNGILQRPPPLGDPQAQQGQQQALMQGGLQGYVQGPASHSAQPPPPLRHNSWSYHQNSDMSSHRGSPAAGTLVPATYEKTQEVVRSRSRHRREEYHYDRGGQSQSVQAPPVGEIVVPVMLCHICSHCGQMRSEGFHRNNPVIPGKPLIPAPCRRCQKKLKSSYRSSSRYTRIRRCTADEPCDWPGEPSGIDIDQEERRGRQRSRREVYVDRYSPSRPRVVRRESSQVNLGLRAFQKSSRSDRTTRTASSSPVSYSRHTGDVWPPPDIVRTHAAWTDQTRSVPSRSFSERVVRDEIWPPPDIVRTQLYRTDDRRPLRRQSSRIIELSPSPPHPRPRSTKASCRSESQERRPRSLSVSPPRAASRGERRNDEAQARLMSHPRPFRTVVSGQHRSAFRASDETSSNAESMPCQRPESPTYSILKQGSSEHHETSYRRRASMRESGGSMYVEVGGPRVHFGSDRKDEGPDAEPRGRPRYVKEDAYRAKDAKSYRDYTHQRVRHDSRPAPRQDEDFEKVHTRYRSVSRERDYQDEIRMDKQRRISPSPTPPLLRREFEEIRVRHVSPLPVRRSAQHRPPSPASSSPPPPSLYRHVSRAKSLDGKHSVARPPPARSRDEDDHTDSGSGHSGDRTTVRTWKGIDERGRPTTFIEERREVRMIGEGSERGSDAVREYRDLGRRERVGVASKTWRDV